MAPAAPISTDTGTIRQAFFKQQIEECRELARHAINADDQAFWKGQRDPG